MEIIRVAGHIDENGRIEIDQQTPLAPGDVLITIERISPQDEVAETAFDELLASQKSLAFLETLVAKTRAERAAGQLIDLDPDSL